MTPSGARHPYVAAFLLCTAALAAACGSASPNAGVTTASSPASAPAGSTASAAPTAAAGAPSTECASTALKAVVNTAQAGAAAGSVYYPIDFTNTSNTRCTLHGYPGISFVTSKGGSQIGDPASRNQAARPETVTLDPGGVAHAILQVAQAGNYGPSACRPVAVRWLKIYPPDQFTAIYARLRAEACSARLPNSQLSVFVIRSGPGKAGQAP